MYLQAVISRKNVLTKIVFCWHLEGQWRKKQDSDPGSGSGSISQRHGSAGPDPLQNAMDPEHRCHENFCWGFLHESSSPKPMKITLGHFEFFKNLWRYSQVKVHHHCQRKTVKSLQLVSGQGHWRQILHQWQIMGTISDCWDLKVA